MTGRSDCPTCAANEQRARDLERDLAELRKQYQQLRRLLVTIGEFAAGVVGQVDSELARGYARPGHYEYIVGQREIAAQVADLAGVAPAAASVFQGGNYYG